MKRIVAAGIVMAVCATFSTGCAQIEDLMGEAEPTTGQPSKPPRPAPALDAGDAKRMIRTWALAYNRAAKSYDVKAAAKLETGSLLEGHRAVFKIAKRNEGRLTSLRATSDVTIPKFTGWPRWFTASMTGKTGGDDLGAEVVFQQDGQGAPWRAASVTWVDGEVLKALGRRVDAPDIAEVVPATDATLAIAPGRLPKAHAHAVRYGAKSPQAKLFGSSVETAADFEQLMDAHRLFRKNGWSGRTTVAGAPHPTYVLRTANGGAVAFYAVDIKASYKRVKGDIQFSWTNHDGLGKLYPALIGSEYAKNEFTRVERTEYATYIPPKGKGKIHVFASRWNPVRVEGS